jgi:hypothetical protein
VNLCDRERRRKRRQIGAPEKLESAGKWGRRFLRERERGENLGGKCANGANYFSGLCLSHLSSKILTSLSVPRWKETDMRRTKGSRLAFLLWGIVVLRRKDVGLKLEL